MLRKSWLRKATATLLALAFFGSLVVAPPMAQAAEESSPVTVYTGGDIITVDDAQPTAEAVAVKDGKILAVGTKEDVMAKAGDGAAVRDLAGHTLIPGFYDAHSHFLSTGQATLLKANLYSPPMGTNKSIDDLIASLKAHAEKQPEGAWIIGTGYDDGQLTDKRHPTADDLDKVSTDVPVLITHFSGHNIVVNHKALEVVGITKDTPDPEGGQIGHNEDGTPNGQLWETAMYPVYEKQPQVTPEQIQDALEAAGILYAKNGFTSVNQGAGSVDTFNDYLKAVNDGRVKQHVNYWFSDWNKAAELYKKYPKGTDSVHYTGKDDLLQLTGVKMFQDGSPQLRTAYMTDPYFTTGEYPEGWKAYPTKPREKLIEDVVATHQAGINQIYIHGNGDAAIDDILAAYETVYDGVKDGSLRQVDVDKFRHVVIHSQFSREEQYEKMKEIHAVPSFLIMHPYFLGDRHWDIYFGPERAARMSPTRDAANNDLRFSLHCDAPVFPTDPLLMLQTAVTRKSFSGRDIFTTTYDKDSKYRSVDQRLTPAEALKALTLDAAYDNGEEDVAGSLTVGKRADLVILDKNPLKVPVDTIKDIKVLETIVNGQAIYTAEGSEPTLEPTKFVDIAGHWAEKDILKAVDAKHLVGVDADHFAPDTDVTRAMVVSVLHRLTGAPEAFEKAGFSDVAEGDWFAAPVDWAKQSGVVNGVGENKFAPNEPVTREQLAAMLANFTEKTKGASVAADNKSLEGFKDVPSAWALPAMSWAVEKGLVAGVGEATLAPQGKASRAQFAAILNRYNTLEFTTP